MPVLFEPPPLPRKDQEFEAFIRRVYEMRYSAIREDQVFLDGLMEARVLHDEQLRPATVGAKVTRPRAALRLAEYLREERTRFTREARITKDAS